MVLLVLSSDALLVALRADVKLGSGESPRLRLPPMAPPSSYIYWCLEAKSGVCALGSGEDLNRKFLSIFLKPPTTVTFHLARGVITIAASDA